MSKIDKEKEIDNKVITDDKVAESDNMSASDNVVEESVENNEGESECIADDNKELVEVQAKCDDLNDKYLRLTAEFDNYRKRTLREKMELTKSAGQDMLIALLPIVDDFERALSHMNDASDVAALREGVELIYNKFNDYLSKRGVAAIDAVNKEFDTDVHEAITKIPAPTPDMKGKVIDCVEKGYMLNDKVIRFSKVVVCE